MIVKNPYENVDFDNDELVQSMTHDHTAPSEGDVESRTNTRYNQGFRHIAWSNYNRFPPPDASGINVNPEDHYGAAPTVPLSRWFDGSVPNVIESPNAEMHAGPIDGGHIITLGSYAGTIGNNHESEFPDVQQGARLWDTQNEQVIEFTSLRQFFDYVLDGIEDPNNPGSTIGGLKYADAGGMIEAHTSAVDRIIRRMDMDSRFIGTDMYNDRRDPNNQKFARPDRGYSVKAWDEVLKTGRFCIAVAEADRGRFGCNMLLLKNFNDHDALKAYRNGNFYAKLKWNDDTLKFTKIDVGENKIEVEADGAVNGLRIIADGEVVATSDQGSVSYTYPINNQGILDLTYIRVEAFGDNFTDEQLPDFDWPAPNYDTGERYDDEIYSQPIMFRTKEQVDRIIRSQRNRKYLAAGLI